MKVKLVVSNEHYEEIKGFLLNHGIEIDDDADLVLSENNRFPDNIVVKDAITNEKVVLPVDEIVYIETYGHTVEVHTKDNTYQAMDRLYKIVNLLNPEKFLRISNSVVISKDKVKKISTTLSMKFILTMVNGIVSTVIVLFIGIIVSLFVGFKIAQNYYEGSIDQFAATDLETYYAEVKEIRENTIIVEGISINEKKYQGEFRYEIGGEVSIVKDDKIISITDLEQGDLISVILIAGEGHVKGITDVFKITVIEESDK